MVKGSGVKLALTGFLLMVGLACVGSALARAPLPEADSPAVALSELPAPAQETYRRIVQGSSFPYEKDGSVFGNRERQLPSRKRGYYREYTVASPGARDRGVRRIVCGGERPRQPDVCYYTDDHYASFRRIVP